MMVNGTSLRLLDLNRSDSTPVANASRCDILCGRVAEMFHRALNRWGIPGAVQPISFEDSVTGDEIEVTLQGSFSVISINGRDYYFDRVTGRFGGTGSGCRQPMR